MTSRFTISPRRIGLLGALVLSGVLSGLTGAARAQDVAYGSYGDPYGNAGGYGGPLIRGEYVGAPFTRVPRPSELVPSAWGYGTYGIPTVAGIRSASVGTPTVYVIDAPSAVSAAPARRARVSARNRARAWSDATAPARAQDRNAPFRAAPAADQMSGGARVIPVRVSHR